MPIEKKMGRKKPLYNYVFTSVLFFVLSLIAVCGLRGPNTSIEDEENGLEEISSWYIWIKRLSNMPIQMGGKKIKRLSYIFIGTGIRANLHIHVSIHA